MYINRKYCKTCGRTITPTMYYIAHNYNNNRKPGFYDSMVPYMHFNE